MARLHKSKKDILHGNIPQQMLLFFFPVFVGYLLQQFYGTVDSIVLGRMVSKQALAGVGGSATAIINLVLNLVSGMTSATTVLVAQNYGRGDYHRVKASVRTGMFAATVFGAILTVTMMSSASSLLELMKEPEETIRISLTYMYLYFASIMPYFIYQTGIAILRAAGDSKRPVYFILLTAIVKVGLDLLLAGVFKLGVLGTSLATFASHLVCAAVIVFIFEHTPDIYQFSFKDFGYDRTIMKQLTSIGLPFSVQSTMFAIPTIFVQSTMNGFGTDAVAAYTAYNAVDNLYWCYSNSISAATLTMAGQNYGSGDISRVRKIVLTAILIEAGGAIAYGLAFYFQGHNILSLFTADPDVLALSGRMLKVICVSYITYALVGPLCQTLKACGEAKATMSIVTVTICMARIAYILLVPQLTPVFPIFAYPLSWILTGAACLLYFLSNKKFRTDKERS